MPKKNPWLLAATKIEKAGDPAYPYTSQRELNNLLEQRYNTQDLRPALPQMLDELGLSQYAPVANLNAELPPEVAGNFNRRTGRMQFDPREADLGVGLHEIGHMADSLEGYQGPRKSSESPLEHHKYDANIEADMYNRLWNQNRIEQGLPVESAMLSRYPELKNINPLSSNKMANPWGRIPRDQLSAELWNLRTAAERK